MLKRISILALFSSLAFCQDATGRVAGTVTDPSGAVIAGAKVTVTNAATGISRETTTGTDGAYQLLQVPIGDYRVAAEAPGFRRTVPYLDREHTCLRRRDRECHIGQFSHQPAHCRNAVERP